MCMCVLEKWYSAWEEAWVCWKALLRGLSSCPSWTIIKIVPFAWEKYRISSWTTCLIRNLDTSMSLAMNLINSWDRCQLWLGSNQQIREFFSYQNNQSEVSELPYLLNYKCLVPILFVSSALSSDWHRNTLKSSYCSFRCEYNAVQHAISTFLEDWIVSWCCVYHSVQLTLVYCIVDGI